MDKFKKTRDALKKAFSNISVSVRVRKIRSDVCGDTRRTENGFLVRINKGQPEQVMLDTLVHEFAHCLTFDEWESTQSHQQRWGVAFAQCYLVYESTVTAAK
jgi:putative component of toxin-antitoxin plasmid stabilization module